MKAAIAISTFFVLSCGNGGGDTPDAMPCNVEVEWGQRIDGNFQAYTSGDKAELTVGFQGFQYVTSSVRFFNVEEVLDRASVDFQITVDGHDPYVSIWPDSRLTTASDGSLFINELLVFFTDIPMPQLVGKTTTILSRGHAGSCVGIHEITVTLADDEQCFELEDGGIECETAGVTN